ncbi:MAG: radical SAM protein [Candidatus Aadella gelida]|nr:radical SAM protein [Candidatus Aadella gelida]
MEKSKYKYIYGPVPSWRLGSSLGVDPISQKEKVCSFDCVYCQIGRTVVPTRRRKVFVPAEEVVKEIKTLPPIDIDFITFSGRGEPTLAKNLGEMINEVKKVREESIAVITNSSLFCDTGVRNDLSQADFVIAKLDAPSEACFKKINNPVRGVNLLEEIEGMRTFLKIYEGKFALQIMFLKQNEHLAEEMAKVAGKIGANEMQLNTPLRPCRVKPLSRKRMEKIEKYFYGLNVISVYTSEKKKVDPVSEKDTLIRRGKVG